MASFPTGFPSAALTDPRTGWPTPAWRAFLVALFERTGSGAGGSLAQLQADLDAETAARQAADTTLSTAISAEATARTAAVGAETTRAEAAEAALAADITALAGNTTLLTRLWFWG